MKKFIGVFLLGLLLLAHYVEGAPPTPPYSLPVQTGNSGKYLTTDGSVASWDSPAGSGDMLEADWATDNKIKTSVGGTGIDSSACTTGAYVDAGVWGCDNATKSRRLDGLVIGTNIPSLTAPVFVTSIESPFLILGSAATAADAGAVRLPNATNLAWEIAATGTDATFGVDSSDDMVAALVAATDIFNITTGNLKVGNGTPAHTLDGEDAYVEGNVEILGNIFQTGSANDVDVAGRIIGRSTTLSFAASSTSDTEPPKLDFWRSLAASAAVVDTSVLGGIYFRGQTSDGLDLGASIVATVSGTPSNDDVPTKLDIFTSVDGAANPITGLSIDKGVSTFNGDLLVTGGQFRLPSSNANPTATAGYLRHDSTVTNHANGALRWHDGTNIRQVVDLVAATAEGCTDDYFVAYDADADLFYCKEGGGGSLSGNLAGDVALATHKITGVTEEMIIPVGSLIDGTAAPGPLATLTSTNKAVYRDFSGTASQDVWVNFELPYDAADGNITFAVSGWITSATGPAENESVSMEMSCTSYGTSDILSGAMGTEVETTFVAGAAQVQYDRWVTSYSGTLVISAGAAGESIVCHLIRDHDDDQDTYAQPIGVSFLKIKWHRSIQ
jgi:hypothetical protein